MSTRGRVIVFGPPELSASVATLGFEPTVERPQLALVDLRDASARVAAAALPPDLPRVLVVGEAEREYAAAMGAQAQARIVDSCEPARLGPALVAHLPAMARRATRVVMVTGARGGVGRTLLATNLARRLAPDRDVCVVDATGSGAGAWWLRCDPSPWSSLESLVREMSVEHLRVAATEASASLRYIGGAAGTPSAEILAATIRTASELGWLVIVDAPPLFDAGARAARSLADRTLLLSYEDATSVFALAAAPDEGDWLIASQSRATKIGSRPVFRALPRDESAVSSATSRRERVGGALGHAYDELAEILAIDAS